MKQFGCETSLFHIGSNFEQYMRVDTCFLPFLNSSRNPWRDFSMYQNVLSQFSSVVIRLLGELPRITGTHNCREDRQYAIFMDNLFSMPQLFALLRDRDIAAVGIVRSNVMGFPKQLAIREKVFTNLDWNTLGAAVFQGRKFLALK